MALCPARRYICARMTESRSIATGGSYAELLRLAGPTVLSRLGVMAMGLTDAIVVGRFSATELGYHSLGWAPTVTILVAALGLLLGVQVLSARHIGAGHPERTGAVLRRGLSYALKIGIVSTAALILIGPWALTHMGLEPTLARGAARALVIFSLSLTPYLLADCFWLWLEAQGRPHVPTIAMWIANAINLGLALWIVPGTSPFPVSGAVAAGWVTLVARTALLLMLAASVLLWKRSRELGVFDPAPRDRIAEREQRAIGYATGLSYGIEAGSFACLNFVAAAMGAMVVAGWAVVMNVASILFMIPLGIAAATGVLVARARGAHDILGVTRSFGRGLALALLVILILSIVIFIMPGRIVSAYTTDAALKAMATGAVLLACLFFMADGAQVVAGSALRARGDIWWPTGMHAISYICVMVPAAWFFGLHMGLGLNGIVWAVVVASFVSAIGLVSRFRWLGDR